MSRIDTKTQDQSKGSGPEPRPDRTVCEISAHSTVALTRYRVRSILKDRYYERSFTPDAGGKPFIAEVLANGLEVCRLCDPDPDLMVRFRLGQKDVGLYSMIA